MARSFGDLARACEEACGVIASHSPSRPPIRLASCAPVAASQILMVVSSLPDSDPAAIGRERNRSDRRRNAPRRCGCSAPVAASHSFSVLSVAARQHAAAIGRERNRADPLECPSKVRMQRSRGRVPQLQRLVLAARQHAGAIGRERNRMDRSRSAPRRCAAGRPWPRPTASASCPRCPTARGLPSGENATEVTHIRNAPRRCGCSAPVAASHSFSVLSPLPDSTRAPSAENATDMTPSECPSKVRISAPVAASHSFSVLSSLPDSTRAPSAENATELTPPKCGMFGTISTWGRSWALACGAHERIARTARPRAKPGWQKRLSRITAPQFSKVANQPNNNPSRQGTSLRQDVGGNEIERPHAIRTSDPGT